MRKLTHFVGHALLLGGFVVAGLSSAAIGADKTIVAIYKSGTQQYFIDEAKGFTDAAKAAGFDAKTINVELDANKAISAMTDSIAGGAAGIAMTAPDQAIGPAVAKAAANAKIPFVSTDDTLKDANGDVLPFVGFDGTDMGTKVGEEAGKLFKAANWGGESYGVLSVEVQTLSVCNDRTNAEKKEIVAAGADQSKIFPVAYDGTTNSALAAAGPVITAHPDVNKWVVFGCNDEGTLGTLNALTNAGFGPGDMIVVGLGAYEACRPWAAGQQSGFKAALYISGVDVGSAAANALIATIDKGTPLPPKTIAKTTIVTPDNYKSVMSCQ
jgi:L-arabinose transport system substrate-binding protein